MYKIKQFSGYDVLYEMTGFLNQKHIDKENIIHVEVDKGEGMADIDRLTLIYWEG